MTTPEAREAYLQVACGRDVTLRRKVDELLKEHFSNDSLLAGSAIGGVRPTIKLDPPPEEAPAQMIGRYKLLEKIGEGGFGEVWMADQREPVKRRVALKIIKLGMDSRQIVARFEAERQALAMMDHANIARIFDADVTDSGRLYFEQAGMSGLDIDTRADIYSLGVLLYELLVGQTPFDAKEMMQGGIDALRQIIREREPLRPSTKLNTLAGDARTTAGKRRQTEVGKLVHQLQGDLDWIVMKCLEKDRTSKSRHYVNKLSWILLVKPSRW